MLPTRAPGRLAPVQQSDDEHKEDNLSVAILPPAFLPAPQTSSENLSYTSQQLSPNFHTLDNDQSFTKTPSKSATLTEPESHNKHSYQSGPDPKIQDTVSNNFRVPAFPPARRHLHIILSPVQSNHWSEPQIHRGRAPPYRKARGGGQSDDGLGLLIARRI